MLRVTRFVYGGDVKPPVVRTRLLVESRDELRERLGCYLLIAVWFLIILPCIAAPWLILHYFGPAYSILCVISVHGLWYLVAGLPMAMSGSKPSTCGWMLILVSTWPAVVVDVVLLLIRLYHAFL